MYMMRVYIREKNEKQYTQTGPVARRLRTTTNLEIVRIRKHQVKWTILKYAETSYKQYKANPARRLTLGKEDRYLRNLNKYDKAINCHTEAKLAYESLKSKSGSELRDILRNTHPDKCNGKEHRRPDFEKELNELRRQKLCGPSTTVRCNKREMKRQLAEQYLSNEECVLKNAFSPLRPEDFVSSIHYKPCYKNVLKADADRYKDGDLSLFDDIRQLSHL